MVARTEDRRWNHSTHYHPDALRLVTAPTRSAVDVGCGEGLLTRRLLSAGVLGARRAGSRNPTRRTPTLFARRR
jgi:2-polyprenyl-3-methyl-5-hydroxy-6-metoxy-1,4-benzoquinol methylase